jgi:hypothetical protein
VKNVLRGADVSAKHIYKLADDYRASLRNLLKEPYENRCICVCPDMWTDPYKQISYMSISISFVDENFGYIVLDLCCQPYVQNDHTGESILTVRATYYFRFLFLPVLYDGRSNDLRC